jgi:2-keto-4-pentenoate hydratase/2-oxohepta-3-ene-1,7-dioic acid hydratase in catechol pathway
VRLARYRTTADPQPRVGHWVDGVLFNVPSADTAAVGGAPADLIDFDLSGAAVLGSGRPVENYELLAPVPRPGKIFGSGINYLSHFEENPTAVRPSYPGFFVKLSSSVVGPGHSIRLPTPETHLDYEVELAVVIGRRGRDLTLDNAMDHVLGYTVVNDVGARDIQFGRGQVDLAKGCDTFCPMGPVLVTADEITDPSVLTVRSWVNGELRQEAPVAELIFSIPELLAAASAHITLMPGDVIATGTPAGCGAFRNPPRWLIPGDEVRVEVDGIGSMSNPVEAGWS